MRLFIFSLSFALLIIAFLAHGQQSQLDTSFGPNGTGVSLCSTAEFQAGSKIHVLADDKILVAGMYKIGSDYALLVMRFLSNGLLDSSFADHGKLETGIITHDDFAWYRWVDNQWIEFLENDNFIILRPSIQSSASMPFIELRCYSKDGIPVPSFGSGGVIQWNLTNIKVRPSAVTQNSARETFITGRYLSTTTASDSGVFVAKIDSNGQAANGFGSQGLAFIRNSLVSNLKISIGPDGRIFLAGRISTSTNEGVAVIAFTQTGSLDRSFGSAGQVVNYDLVTPHSNPFLIDKHGRLLIGGSGTSAIEVRICRLKLNGQRDLNFGSSGLFTYQTTSGAFPGRPTSFKLLDNEQILVLGETVVYNTFMIRLDTTGTLDHSFAPDGMIMDNEQDEVGLFDADIQSSGKIVKAGSWVQFPLYNFILARFDSIQPIVTYNQVSQKRPGFRISPNPSSFIVSLSLEGIVEELCVLNATGVVVRRLHNVSGNQKLMLQQKGLYFFVCKQGAEVTTQKVIVE